MPWANYVASESIIPIHAAGTQYTLQFQLQIADQGNKIEKAEPRALAGNKETLYFGRTRTWMITLDRTPVLEMPLIEEFLYSTADGQVFTFDPYGSPLNPVRPMVVDRQDMGHTVRRAVLTGDPVHTDLFEFSFELNERL